MNFRQKLLNRHKNPIGLVLRVINYFGIGYALWTHDINLIALLVLADLLNWFFMPMVKPKNELEIVNKIVQQEIEWIKSPWTFTKKISVVIGLGLFICLGVGIWRHHWIWLTVSFILLVILKQILLKTTKG